MEGFDKQKGLLWNLEAPDFSFELYLWTKHWLLTKIYFVQLLAGSSTQNTYTKTSEEILMHPKMLHDLHAFVISIHNTALMCNSFLATQNWLKDKE